MSLSEQKRNELEVAIYDYLKSRNYIQTCSAFENESKASSEMKRCQEEKISIKSSILVGNLLEKKWTLLSRQQHKIMQLESKIEQLQKELDEYKSGEVYRKKKLDEKSCLLPVEPYKFELNGHRDSVTCLALHPVYPLMASSSDDATIKIWDYESGELEKSLRGHTNNVNYVTYDPTGKLLASCSADLTLRLWDTNTNEVIKVFTGHEHNVSCVAFLPSGDKLVSASRDQTIKVWDLSTGHCKLTLKEPGWVKRVVVNHDGTLIATCNADNNIRVWNLTTQKCIHTLRKHTHIVECISFSDPTDFQLEKPSIIEGKNGNTGSISNGTKKSKVTQYLISGGRDKLIYVWNIETGNCIATLRGHDSWVKDVYILPNMKQAISCSDDRSIRIWDLQTEFCTRKINNAHPHFVSCMKLSRQRPIIATGSVDTTVRVWECR